MAQTPRRCESGCKPFVSQMHVLLHRLHNCKRSSKGACAPRCSGQCTLQRCCCWNALGLQTGHCLPPALLLLCIGTIYQPRASWPQPCTSFAAMLSVAPIEGIVMPCLTHALPCRLAHFPTLCNAIPAPTQLLLHSFFCHAEPVQEAPSVCLAAAILLCTCSASQ